ncbi:hypothetical protein RRF57_006114 [Xylaria bambusicola]|uniref:Uncharacterized protein n=1 Tax=Xylaria bambusicola TaxID=326684 RepID=A0AAN7UN85_9PEZI
MDSDYCQFLQTSWDATLPLRSAQPEGHDLQSEPTLPAGFQDDLVIYTRPTQVENPHSPSNASNVATSPSQQPLPAIQPALYNPSTVARESPYNCDQPNYLDSFAGNSILSQRQPSHLQQEFESLAADSDTLQSDPRTITCRPPGLRLQSDDARHMPISRPAQVQDEPVSDMPPGDTDNSSPRPNPTTATPPSQWLTPGTQLPPSGSSTDQHELKCCGYTFGRQSELNRHKKELHSMHGSPSNIWFCPFLKCSRNRELSKELPFKRAGNLEGHIRRMHRDKLNVDPKARSAEVKKLCDDGCSPAVLVRY